jgi:hypothetical protein
MWPRNTASKVFRQGHRRGGNNAEPFWGDIFFHGLSKMKDFRAEVRSGFFRDATKIKPRLRVVPGSSWEQKNSAATKYTELEVAANSGFNTHRDLKMFLGDTTRRRNPKIL